jgi:predicted ATPase
MIDRVTGNKPLPVVIKRDIVERTDGIPLFVEEITKAVLEAGGEGAELVLATAPPSSVPVPASLQASLMARLDRLGSAKEIAQIGAAIGREFSYALLAAVAGKPEVEVRSALDRLLNAGLLFRQGVPPNATYLFKHALVQDAAYGTLLRDPRRSLHMCVAQAIEDQFAEIAESQPEVLARHFTEAGVIEKAATLWAKAGQRSLERSALVEGIEQLTRALDQFALLPKTSASRREQIKVQVALISPLIHIKGYAAPEPKRGCRESKIPHRGGRKARGTPRRPVAIVYRPLRHCGGKLRANKWRRPARCCVAVLGARAEASRSSSRYDCSSCDGARAIAHGVLCQKPRAL